MKEQDRKEVCVSGRLPLVEIDRDWECLLAITLCTFVAHSSFVAHIRTRPSYGTHKLPHTRSHTHKAGLGHRNGLGRRMAHT